MSKHRWGLAMVVSLVLVSVAPQANGAGGTLITTCAQVVTANAVLTQNLYCPGLSGVVVGASGITVDLKGFSLRGDRTSSRYGVDNTAGFDAVTIKNGIVRNFDVGVVAYADANNFTVANVFASGNSDYGIIVGGDSAVVKSSTTSGNEMFGIEIDGNLGTIQSSVALGNDFGIRVLGSGVKILKSTVSGNEYYGIGVSGSAALLKGNRAEANGFINGAVDLVGPGILVDGYSTAPVGKNVARGNDDLNECVPALLC